MAETAELEIVVRAKDDASKTLQGISSSVQGMSKQFKIAGAAMVAAAAGLAAALGMSIKKFAEAGDEVQKMALRTGFATETLSELRHALEICGADLSLMDMATRRMSKAIVDANDGMTTYVRAFDRIGLSVQELQALQPEEQFWTIAMAIADLEDQTLKAATAQDIFGRSGTQLLPLLAEGAAGIAELREEAHELGIVFDQEAADKAAEFNDSMTRLNEAVSGLQMAFAEELIPIIKPFIDWLTKMIKKFGELDDGTKKIIAAATVATTVFLGLAGTFLLFLGFLPNILKGFTILQTFVMTKLIPTIITLIGWLKAKIAALILSNAFMMNWVGLALAAAAAAAAIGVAFALVEKQAAKANREMVKMPVNIPELTPGQNIQIPSYQYGGVVPGTPGAPQLVIAHGGERFLGVGRQAISQPIYLTFNYQSTLGLATVNEMREAADRLREYLRESEVRGYTEIP